MWVLEATRDGVPLAQLLGGTRTEIATGISLGIQSSPEALVERAARCARRRLSQNQDQDRAREGCGVRTRRS
jgi:L-alanine-DL-glutamate epimerase-like enolase superfamily enzyme